MLLLFGLSPWMSNIDLIQALGGGWLADGGSSLAACQTANREADSRKQDELQSRQRGECAASEKCVRIGLGLGGKMKPSLPWSDTNMNW